MLRAVLVHDPWPRERKELQQPAVSYPVHVSGTTAAKPEAPDTLRLAKETLKRTEIRRDAEVAVVPVEFLREGLLLRAQWFVPMVTTPLSHSA